jgi:hypothetical protein
MIGDLAQPMSGDGTFYGAHTPLKMKIFLRKLQDEGTGSTFDALERRGLIICKYTWERKNREQAEERFLMVQITKEGRKLVRSATGEQSKKALPVGTLREWHGTGEQWPFTGRYFEKRASQQTDQSAKMKD